MSEPPALTGSPQEGHPSPEATVDTPVADVSVGGIGVVTAQRFEAGTPLGIALPARPPATVLACVIHATGRPGPPWTLGCQFALPLEKEDVQRFHPRTAGSRRHDRRAWTRFPCTEPVACWPVPAFGVRRLAARPARTTRTGAVVLATHPVDVGRLFEWAIPGALTILASVVRVAAEGEAWAVACQFIRELTDAELRAVRANGKTGGR